MFKPRKMSVILAIFALAALLFRFYLVLLTDKVYERERCLKLNLPSCALFDKFTGVFGMISPLDYLTIFMSSIVLIAALILICRRYTIVGIFNYLLSNNIRACIFLVFLSFLLAAAYFSPGIPYAGDGWGHLFASWVISKSVIAKEPTLWTNYFWGGFPYFRYYGPLFYYLVATVNLFFRDVVFSLKFFLAICHIASAISMFMFLSLIVKDRLKSFIGALSYVYIYFHYFQVVPQGRMRSSLLYFILPFLFYYLELLVQRGEYKSIILFGLFLGSMILVHPGYYSIFAILFLSLYILVRCLTLTNLSLTKKSYLLAKAAVGFLFGLSISSWIWFPMYIERIAIDLKNVLIDKAFELPAPFIKTLFLWSRDPMPNFYASYLGISILVLSCCGLYYAILKRDRVGNIFVFFSITTAFLIFGSSFKMYQYIPFVYIPPSSGYFMLFEIFFLSVLTCYGAELIFNFFKINRYRLGFLISCIIFLDLIPLSFQDNYPNRIPHQHNKKLQWLNSEQPKNKQILELGELHFTWYAPVYTGFPVINIPDFRVGSPRVLRSYLRYLVKKIRNEIEFSRLSSFSRDSLYLMNIGYMTGWHDKVPKIYLEKIINFENGVWAGKLSDSSPVIAANEIVLFNENLSYEDIVEQMHLDKKSKTCKRIFIYSDKNKITYFPCRTYNPPYLRLFEHKIKNSEISLKIDVSSDCYLNLAYTYYPDLKIFFDNKLVKEAWQTSFGSICIYSPQGEHNIIIRPGFSKLRVLLTIFSILVFLCSCSFLLKKK